MRNTLVEESGRSKARTRSMLSVTRRSSENISHRLPTSFEIPMNDFRFNGLKQEPRMGFEKGLYLHKFKLLYLHSSTLPSSQWERGLMNVGTHQNKSKFMKREGTKLIQIWGVNAEHKVYILSIIKTKKRSEERSLLFPFADWWCHLLCVKCQ